MSKELFEKIKSPDYLNNQTKQWNEKHKYITIEENGSLIGISRYIIFNTLDEAIEGLNKLFTKIVLVQDALLKTAKKHNKEFIFVYLAGLAIEKSFRSKGFGTKLFEKRDIAFKEELKNMNLDENSYIFSFSDIKDSNSIPASFGYDDKSVNLKKGFQFAHKIEKL